MKVATIHNEVWGMDMPLIASFPDHLTDKEILSQCKDFVIKIGSGHKCDKMTVDIEDK